MAVGPASIAPVVPATEMSTDSLPSQRGQWEPSIQRISSRAATASQKPKGYAGLLGVEEIHGLGLRQAA